MADFERNAAAKFNYYLKSYGLDMEPYTFMGFVKRENDAVDCESKYFNQTSIYWIDSSAEIRQTVSTLIVFCAYFAL